MRLSLTLLGAFQITLDGEPVTGFESDKVRALLAYLAVESDRPHRRDALAEMFWLDRPPGVARNNLKQALSNLRKATGDREANPPFLRINRTELQFNPDSDHWLDLRACSTRLAACQSHKHRRVKTCKPCIRRLREAEALYQGPFLEQFYLGDSAAFEEWALVQREGLQRQMMAAFPHLVAHYEQHGEHKRACEFARRQVELEPWDEVAQRQLMRALALGGQQSAALKQYLVCRRTLADELGLEPTPETTELFEQIRAGKYERSESPPRKTSAEARESSKSQPFGRRAWTMIFILSLAISLGLLAWLVKLHSNQTAVDPENTGTPSLTITHTSTTATALHPNDTPTAIYPFTGQQDIPRTEYQALVALYNETKGPGWKDSSGWLSDTTPCNWFGVTCSEGSVTELDLQNNDLNGYIPPEIGLLTELTVLNLEFNQLSGSIPPELGTMRRLNYLALHNNLFDGPIPPELGNLPRLTSLDLRENWLSGDFPSELGSLSNLVYLDLSENAISGSIPPQLGKLSNLVFASLEGNQLSGPLPPELGNLSNLVSLNLQSNTLSGPIPPEIGKLSNLRLLDLGDNQFSGSLPTELGNLTDLRELYVYLNSLSGPLPVSATNLNYEAFHFYGTDLCEPPDAAFQEWLNGIQDLGRHGILLCQTDVYSPTGQTDVRSGP